MPMLAFQDAIPALADVDGTLANVFRKGYERFCQDDPVDFPPLLNHLDQFFLTRFFRTEGSPLLDEVLTNVITTAGRVRIEELAKLTGYSERHLGRLASEKIGLNLKLLSRIVRVNNACARLQGHAVSLTRLAHDLDYHDQAHFIHDFEAICGVSPDRYRKNSFGFYNEDLKMAGIVPDK